MRSKMSNAAARAGDTAGRDSRVLDFTVSSMTDRTFPQEKFDPLIRQASRRATVDNRE